MTTGKYIKRVEIWMREKWIKSGNACMDAKTAETCKD